MPDRDNGFTLVELLVVIVIVGILAAIAVPILVGQRQRAVEATMRSDLRTTAELMETYFHDRQAYPGSFADLVAVVSPDGQLSGDNLLSIDTAGGVAGTYCLTAANDAAPQAIRYDSDGGGILPPGQACG